MTVANTTSRNQYTATSGQTVFPYTFEIFDKGDVVVLKNGTALSEGTNYTVSGVGNDSGGNITLTVGATAGDGITIYRDMPLNRLTDYQTSGDFLAQEVNDDFDRLWLASQQLDDKTSRAIRAPESDSGSINLELGSSTARANKFLSFDASGNVITVAASGSAATDASNVTYTPAGTNAVATTVQSELRLITSDVKNLSSRFGFKPELIAHRGFRSLSMQNTMLALTSALDRGADSLEMDVQISSDGYPVLFHDTTVDALTSGTGAVSSLSLSTLQGLTFSSLSGTPYADERIPLFSEVLAYAKKRGIMVYPEIKAYRTQADIDLIIAEVVNAGMEDLCVLQSFQWSDVVYVRSKNLRIGVGFLGSNTDLTVTKTVVDALQNFGNSYLLWSGSALLAIPDIVDYAYDRNVDIATWTINSLDTAESLLDIGVIKMMSDFNVLGGLK